MYRPTSSWFQAFAAFALPSPLGASDSRPSASAAAVPPSHGGAAASAADCAAACRASLQRICSEAKLPCKQTPLEWARLLPRAEVFHKNGCNPREAWGRASAEFPELQQGRALVELFLVWKTSTGNLERRFRVFREVATVQRARLLDITVEACLLADQAPSSAMLRSLLPFSQRKLRLRRITSASSTNCTSNYMDHSGWAQQARARSDATPACLARLHPPPVLCATSRHPPLVQCATPRQRLRANARRRSAPPSQLRRPNERACCRMPVSLGRRMKGSRLLQLAPSAWPSGSLASRFASLRAQQRQRRRGQSGMIMCRALASNPRGRGARSRSLRYKESEWMSFHSHHIEGGEWVDGITLLSLSFSSIHLTIQAERVDGWVTVILLVLPLSLLQKE